MRLLEDDEYVHKVRPVDNGRAVRNALESTGDEKWVEHKSHTGCHGYLSVSHC